jgi:uncharacterized protein DUF2637
MTAETTDTSPPAGAGPEQGAGVPPLTRQENWLLGLGVTLSAAVGALGLASSFESLKAAAGRWGFAHPWMLPAGIDTAIPAFTLAHLLLIRMDMRLGWVRVVPWALTAVTCWLNIAAGDSLSAKVAHGVMPLLWVVLSEIAAHVYAVRIGAATGRRMDRIRRSRWLLAPVSTFALWRRMVLWEITSYPQALTRERERQLSRAQLRERYGRAWRRAAPKRERTLLKLGELAPAGAVPPATPDPAPAPGPPKPPSEPGTTPRRPRTTAKSTRPGRSRRTEAELLAEARKATAGWDDSELNAEKIRTTLRIAPGRARRLRDVLKAERRQPPGSEPLGVAA